MKKNLEQKNISGWGGYPIQKAKVVYPQNINQILDEIKKSDVCIVSHPFALYGRRHDQFDWLIEKCD